MPNPESFHSVPVVVIEVSGGTVIGEWTLSGAGEPYLVIIDWDNIKEGDNPPEIAMEVRARLLKEFPTAKTNLFDELDRYGDNGKYVIYSAKEQKFWSNMPGERGWRSLEMATPFEPEERAAFTLPTADSDWVSWPLAQGLPHAE